MTKEFRQPDEIKSEHLAMNGEAKKLLRAYAKEDYNKADSELLSAVAKDTGYYANDLRQLYDVWYTNALKTKIYLEDYINLCYNVI